MEPFTQHETDLPSLSFLLGMRYKSSISELIDNVFCNGFHTVNMSQQ